jgi:uncharacterized membrane protein YphA (DoxX/SURF4 family)
MHVPFQNAALATSCITLGLVFLSSGIIKVPQRRDFIYVVVAYRVLPARLSIAYRMVLPWIEILLGVMLLLGVRTRVAGVASVALLFSFTFAVVLNVARGRMELNCGCFGPRRRDPISVRTIIRNLILVLLGLVASTLGSGQMVPEWLLGLLGRPDVAVAVPVQYVAATCLPLGGLLVLPLIWQSAVLVRRRRNRPAGPGGTKIVERAGHV